MNSLFFQIFPGFRNLEIFSLISFNERRLHLPGVQFFEAGHQGHRAQHVASSGVTERRVPSFSGPAFGFRNPNSADHQVTRLFQVRILFFQHFLQPGPFGMVCFFFLYSL